MATRIALTLMFLAAGAAAGQEPVIPPPVLVQPPAQTPPDPLPPGQPRPGPPPTGPQSVVPEAPALIDEPPVFLPDGGRINLPAANKQKISYSPRYGVPGNFTVESIGDDTRRAVYTAGLIIKVEYALPVPPRTPPKIVEYEFAADRVVIWERGGKGTDVIGGGANGGVETGRDTQVELFLAGNVVIRSQEMINRPGGGRAFVYRTLRADSIYYDVANNRAVAQDANLEVLYPGMTDPVFVAGQEIHQLGRREFEAVRAAVYSSKLPSDPALRFASRDVHLIESEQRRRNFLGFTYRQTDPALGEVGPDRTLTARHAKLELLGVPIFYTPYLRTDPSEPLGPLRGISFGNDRIFGAQVYTTWDVYSLLALRPPRNHNWRLNLDYLSDRGVPIGTDYSYANPDLFGFGGKNVGLVRAYGLHDGAKFDTLGGFRGVEPERPPPGDRGRFLWRHQQEIFADKDDDSQTYTGGRFLYWQSQFAWLSDKNFLEQYFKREFDFGLNQETFAYLSGSSGQWYGNLLVQGGQSRKWVTETQALPRVSGAVIGQSLFDLFSYDSRASVGYFQYRPASIDPLPILATERTRTDVTRGNWWQELSLPVRAGPVSLVPYGVLDLTAYSQDLTGESAGRVYGGGGVRSAVTLSKLYPDVSSELFNLRGLNHKVTLGSNWYYARSSEPYTRFPLLDRLNDDAVDQSYRTAFPWQKIYLNQQNATSLTTDPWYDPQRYAIRRLLENRVDTLDNIHAVQLNANQRWQTKRGFRGAETTTDWLTVDVSATLFPDNQRDNFGKSAAFFEYNTLWNVGDRTALAASGWFDPFPNGARFWTAGVYFSRPDRTNLYLGYRQTDPLQSKAVVAAVNYQLTRKYAINVSAAYDFGIQQALTNSVLVTRTGTDVTIGLGFTYNALINNFGVQFAIIPNLAAGRGFGLVGPAQLGQEPR